MFIMLTTNSSGSGDEWGKLSTVRRHGVSNCGVEKEFSCVKGVRGDSIKDAFLHLAVFFGAEPSGPLVVVRVPGLSKLRNDDLKPCVIACISTKES